MVDRSMKKRLFLMLLGGLQMALAPVSAQTCRERAESLVSKMTLEEKASLVSGQVDGFHTAAIPRLGIPSIRMADGPQGVRNKTRSTFYPCGISLASTWNPDLAREMGRGLALDAGPGASASCWVRGSISTVRRSAGETLSITARIRCWLRR